MERGNPNSSDSNDYIDMADRLFSFDFQNDAEQVEDTITFKKVSMYNNC